MTNPNPGIVIIATLTATPEKRDHLLQALQELLPAARAEGAFPPKRESPGGRTATAATREVSTHFGLRLPEGARRDELRPQIGLRRLVRGRAAGRR